MSHTLTLIAIGFVCGLVIAALFFIPELAMQIEHIHIVYLLIALQVGDAATTIYALEREGTRERNGRAAKVFAAIGLVPGTLLIKAGVLGLIWYLHASTPDWVLIGACVGSAALVLNNLNVIRKLKQA